MNAYQAQRIRFGILAARHTLARDRLTPGQVDDLEGMELVGWRVGNAGTRKAFDRETDRLQAERVQEEIEWGWVLEARRAHAELERRALTEGWAANAHPDSIIGRTFPSPRERRPR